MDLSWIIGRSKIEFHHAQNSLKLPLKTGIEVSLADFCKSVTPPCNLSPFLPGGNLQTFYTVVCKTDIPINYRRKVFESTDASYPGSFAVDFVSQTTAIPDEDNDGHLHPRTVHFKTAEWKQMEAGSQDSRPMLVVLHGISGGSHELYLREVLAPLTNHQEDDRKWEACVVNARGCARSAITSSVLFNARATWDVRQTVKWLRQTYPNRPLFGIGFSLGANILVNYAGEEGDDCQLKAILPISNPWDLHAGSLALQRSWIGLEVYSKTLGGNMKKLFKQHIEEISKNPRIDVEKIMKTKYLHEFDRELQGPTWGYPTEGAYYRDASSTESLLNVKVPLFSIHANDDPVAPREGLPFEEIEQNPNAVLCTTTMGGHLSWFESGQGRWFVKPIVGFLRKMADEVDLGRLKGQDLQSSGMSTQAGVPEFKPMRRKLELPR